MATNARNSRTRAICVKAFGLVVIFSVPVGAQTTYTTAQAERGATLYQSRCAACHGEDVEGDRNGVTPPLYGPVFEGNWDGLPLGTLLDRIRQEAQQAKPAGLSRQQQVDVLAFLLAKNRVPAGSAELSSDSAALASVNLATLRALPPQGPGAPQPGASTIGASYPPAFPRKNATKLFETERFTIWNIVWPKGEPTPLHRHLYDQVGTYYAPGGRTITTPDGEARMTTTEAGSLSNTRAGTTHIEEGTTDPPLRAVFIELKKVPASTRPSGAVSPDASGALALLNPAGAKRVMNDERVTVWDWTADRPGPFRVRPARDVVIVWLGSGDTHLARPGVVSEVGGEAGRRAIIFEIK
jgi:mono/diheme cytochrome c family protein